MVTFRTHTEGTRFTLSHEHITRSESPDVMITVHVICFSTWIRVFIYSIHCPTGLRAHRDADIFKTNTPKRSLLRFREGTGEAGSLCAESTSLALVQVQTNLRDLPTVPCDANRFMSCCGFGQQRSACSPRETEPVRRRGLPHCAAFCLACPLSLNCSSTHSTAC